MEGFELRDVFHPKEIAIVDVNYRAVRFDVKLPEMNLNEEESKIVRFVTENVHGMNFNNCASIPRIMLKPEFVKKFVTEHFERERIKLKKPILVAFKGGRFERSLLEDIGISYVDLEDYGCPRYDYLIETFPNVYHATSFAYLFNDTTQGMFCDLHVIPTSKIVHCPVAECRAFVTWLNIANDQSIVISSM